jgi:hypothetical protein
MRYLTAALSLSMFVAAARADEPTAANEPSRGAMPKETVTFDDHKLVLAYEARDEDGDAIKEFIPADEDLDSWTRLAAIRVHADLDDPQEFGEQMVKELEQRKPPAEYALMENERTGDVVLTFLISPEDESFVEFNVFKYQKRAEGGLLSEQYALRAYGDDVEKFTSELTPEKRLLLVGLMNKDGVKPE